MVPRQCQRQYSRLQPEEIPLSDEYVRPLEKEFENNVETKER